MAFTLHFDSSLNYIPGGTTTMKSSISFLMFLAIISQSAFAKEDVLATITNDQNQNVYKFIAETSEETHSITALYKDEYIQGKRVDRGNLSSQDLANSSGVILEQQGAREIVNLKSDNFDLERGGRVTIDTLYNGITGERKAYELELAQSRDGWKLFKGQKAISKLHMITNRKMFVGAVGVKEIQMK